MNKYEVIKTIGEGAYGVVLQCRNKETGELVAIKRFKESDEDDLVRKTTLREVKILRLLKEETFVVHLLEAFRRKGKLYLVFEYVGCNLLDVLEQHPQGLDMEDVRRMIFTLMLGVRACHSNSVIHRDIKPENLLLHTDNTLRLCDFGFARIYNNSMNDLTDYVATRWYRSPELLLGTTNYGLPSDMWAIGCIMAEMIDGQAVFPGESELDQIFMIQKLLGNFTPQQQEVFRKNKRFANETLRDISKTETTLERKYGRKANKKAMHFLKSLLVIDPEKRLTVDEAISHPFFEGMLDTYAPHLKLITPMIRPSTATRAYSTMQTQVPMTQQHYAQGTQGDAPPRPSSTSLEPQQQFQSAPVAQYSSIPSTTLVNPGTTAPPGQLSSRVSQASSNTSAPPAPQQAPKSGAAASSFLPSRIGSGHRRPPSQQRIKDDVFQGVQGSPEYSGYGQPSSVPAPQQNPYQAPARAPINTYGVSQSSMQMQMGSPYTLAGGAPMYTTGNINPNLNPASYAVAPGYRGNLPKLGQVPQVGGISNTANNNSSQNSGTTFTRFGSGSGNGLVNGGSNPSRVVDAPANSSGLHNYKPPPSQQASRSRFFYS